MNNQLERLKKIAQKRIILSALLISAITSQVEGQSTGKKEKRPNIVIILADDMGFSDLGCYGGEIHTPNIDFLAANGLRFSQFYNTSRCCPSRAALLTGLYNQQAGIGEMTEDRHKEGYRGYLTENTVTLAEVLKTAGYHTAMVGKWHVSNTVEQKNPENQMKWLNHQEEHPLFSTLEQYPTHRGFEQFYGTLWGVVDFYDPFTLVNGETAVKTVPQGYYHTDAINDTAVAFIRRFGKDEQPFFMYVAHNAPHWPLMALPEDIDKYKDTYTVGWDAIRKARYSRLISLGIIDSTQCPLSPRWEGDLSWEDNQDREWDARAMAVHAAMIDRMDQGIGRIIQSLRETGQLDNTLIMILSDNGASPEDCSRYGSGFDRPSQTRSGESINYSTDKKVKPGPETTYGSIGPRWANVANTPFKLAKAESYEGGIHTPFITFWPKGILAKKGSISDHVGHIMDFMPTLVELAHATYPAQYKGHAITPFQGISLAPAFKEKQFQIRDALFNEHFGARYVRYQDWKLVSSSKDTTWHLYHISIDKSEMKDLAQLYPDKVKEMDRLWHDWATHNKVLPKPKK